MSGFDGAFAKLISSEGGFTDNPKDRGNWTGGRRGVGELKGTKFGISAASYPKLDIKALTLPEAREIYLRDFWNYCRCDDLSDALAFLVFDMAVNSGPDDAIKALQASLGVVADGRIGEKTLAAIKASDKDALFRKFNGARLMHVSELDPMTFTEFGRGLIRRIARHLMA